MEASYLSVLRDESMYRLRNALKSAHPNFTGGCVLHWTPDQGEDIFLVLVSESQIISVELDRQNSTLPPVVEYISVTEYKRGLKKSNQIKLATALSVLSEQQVQI